MSASSREKETISSKNLIAEGFIPGIVYGHGCENVSVKVGKKEFLEVLDKAGESSLISVKIDDKELGNVVIKDYQTDPVTGEVIHFDLHKVRMDEKIITNVEVKVIGESPAVKSLGGILVIVNGSLEMKCLPKDLIHEVEVDISNLKEFEDIIRVKDIKISDNVEILNGEEDVVVSVSAPRTQTEIEDLDEKPEENIEEVEGSSDDKEKKETEEETK